MAVDSVIRDATAPYRAGRGLLGLVAVAAVLFATMALVAANGRAAWRGLALGLAGGIGALWCGSGLLTAVPGLAVSPLALGLGLVAGLVGVIDLVALRRSLVAAKRREGACVVRPSQPAEPASAPRGDGKLGPADTICQAISADCARFNRVALLQ